MKRPPRFDQCLRLTPYCAHALDSKAQAHARLGHGAAAEQCRKQAALIRETLWNQQVTASVRASHPLFGRSRPG